MTENNDSFTSTLAYVFLHEKMGYEILRTIDNRVLIESLYYSDDKDAELSEGRKIRINVGEFKNSKFVISGIKVHYYRDKIMNMSFVGEPAYYNGQITIYVVDDK